LLCDRQVINQPLDLKIDAYIMPEIDPQKTLTKNKMTAIRHISSSSSAEPTETSVI